MDVDFCGKFGTFALFATRKWNLCGKPELQWQFATRERLEKPGADWRRLIMVANLGLRVYLSPESRICVANGVTEADLPPE